MNSEAMRTATQSAIDMTAPHAERVSDALISSPSETFDYVLANPPFGKMNRPGFTGDL